jgi:transcriptional regulator with PAS, ATPase and Fis domain
MEAKKRPSEGAWAEVRDCSNGNQDETSTVSTVDTVFRFGRAVSRSQSMLKVLATLSRLAPTELTITLVGETGTGKDVLSQAIHEHSGRSRGPFVVFDCGAVAATLAESELFGHERGAFTGAQASHPGAFERANGGSLFLDEIGELPLELQPRLLRALENRGVRRVGGTQYRPVDLRVIAATNRDLPALAAQKLFRQDLFFRLATVVVPIPALRQRADDLPLIVPMLLADLGRPDIRVPEETYDHLRAHPWPGNIRELKNALASALAFVDGDVLEPRHTKLMVPQSDASRLEQLPLGGKSLESLERLAIQQTLMLTGSKAKAARALGISLSTLYEKLKKFGL